MFHCSWHDNQVAAILTQRMRRGTACWLVCAGAARHELRVRTSFIGTLGSLD